jgi:hypothetical protein
MDEQAREDLAFRKSRQTILSVGKEVNGLIASVHLQPFGSHARLGNIKTFAS